MNQVPSLEEIQFSDWMKKAQAGDKVAYLSLLKELERKLHSFCGAYLARSGFGKEDGRDDVVQEVLMAIHLKRHTYRPDAPFFPWFYSIARHKAVDYMRRTHRKKFVSDVEMESLEAPEIDNAELARMDLHELMSALSDKQKQVLELVKLDGLSIEEAATKLCLSVSDVKVSIHRAMTKLKEEQERRHT